jgi:four helix bundle protein
MHTNGTYRDLDAWRAGIDLAVTTYAVAQKLPDYEKFGLATQMRRAAASVPANIAEGYGRDSDGDFVRMLRIAQGSVKELETHAIVAKRVGLLTDADCAELENQLNVVGKLIRGLVRWAQSRRAAAE